MNVLVFLSWSLMFSLMDQNKFSSHTFAAGLQFASAFSFSLYCSILLNKVLLICTHTAIDFNCLNMGEHLKGSDLLSTFQSTNRI